MIFMKWITGVFLLNAVHPVHHRMNKLNLKAKEYEEHWEPYTEYFVQNKKTLETIWLNVYLRLSVEQRYLPMNDNKEKDGSLEKMRLKHRLYNVRVQQELKSFRIYYKTMREDELHRNPKLYLKKSYSKEKHDVFIKEKNIDSHSVIEWFNNVNITVCPENI